MREQARDAFYLLIVVVAGVLTAVYFLQLTATEAGQGVPPWSAVFAAAIVAIALFLREPVDKTAVYPQKPPSNPQSLRHFLHSFSATRLFLLLGAAICLAYSLLTIPQLGQNDSYLLVTAAWLAAVGLWLTAVLPTRCNRTRTNADERGLSQITTSQRRKNQALSGKSASQTSFSTRWQNWKIKDLSAFVRVRPRPIFLLLLLLAAFLLRVWRLETIPFTLGGDEASQGLEAVRVLEGTLRNPLGTGWLGVPTMSFFFNSLTIALFGRTIFGLRLAWALVGTANVLVTFLLVRRLAGEKMGWLTAVLLATYHYHIHFSRLGSNQIADPLFLSLALWLLVRALDEGKRRDWGLVGLVSGFAFYFYAGARLTPVVVLAVIAYQFSRAPRHFWRQHQTGLLIMLLTFLIAAAPMLQYAARFPDEFNARLNTVGIFQSGWLEREVELRQQSHAAVLWDQFQRAAMAFTYYPDRTVWYGLRQPLLDPFFGAMFLLGLLFGTAKLLWWRQAQPTAPLVAWWWGGMLLGGMLTESPPSSQRLITLAVPTCFFVALGLWEVGEMVKTAVFETGTQTNAVVNGLLALAVVVFATISLNTYFNEAVPQRLYGGSHAELATELAPRLNALKGDHRFFFVGAPWMYWNFATLPYLVADAEAVDVGEPPELPPADLSLLIDKGVVYIFLPERFDELTAVQQTLPGGMTEDVVAVNGRLLATLYIVDD
ncbi:MAG: glycosyltransferase family 39 protein [Anaerolineales bacterium]|nr:glycosyltransferase family 39 protein [Anaerolineales bacterium]